ncbi:MAG: hypothetical protein RLZZ301_953 [Bacteroidota bacterium]|jgi:hypothetical protein
MKRVTELVKMSLLLGMAVSCFFVARLLKTPILEWQSSLQFTDATFSYEANPFQLLRTWLFEQQFQAQDTEVQSLLQKLQAKPDAARELAFESAQVNWHEPAGMYLLPFNGQHLGILAFSCENKANGIWLNNKHLIHFGHLFLFSRALNPNEQAQVIKRIRLARQIPYTPFKARQQQLLINRLHYQLNWEAHSVELKRTFVVHPSKNYHQLKPNGFHISCPLAIKDKLIDQQFPALSEVNYLSMNYEGARLNEEQEVQLSFELLLDFSSSKARALFLSEFKSLQPNWNWQANFVSVNRAVYALKPVGKHQLYICSHPKEHLQNGQFQAQQSKEPIVCAGDPKLLTKIEDAGWAGAILEMIPIYQSLSDLSAHTAKIQTADNCIRWEFKPHYFAANELIKLFSGMTPK